MTSNHTQGPWYLNGIVEHHNDVYIQEIVGNNDEGVIWATYDGEIKTENIKNLNLIEAAPDMLDALELLSINLTEESLPMYVWDAIDKAIAKAKGETK